MSNYLIIGLFRSWFDSKQHEGIEREWRWLGILLTHTTTRRHEQTHIYIKLYFENRLRFAVKVIFFIGEDG